MGVNKIDDSHPSFGDPVKSCLKFVFPPEDNVDDINRNKLTNTNNVEISMRSHLFTLTDALLQHSDTGNEKTQQILKDLLDFLTTCLKFCEYVLKCAADTTKTVNIIRIKLFPFTLLEDTFDTITTHHANMVWTKFIEDKSISDTLFSEIFFNPKNKLVFIRMCNNLHKKVSAQVKFSGRILMRLTAVMPLSDRSAINVIGKSNTEKEITFDNEEDFIQMNKVFQENNPQSSHDRKSMDYQFYKTFWGLQRFFSDPKSIAGKKKEFENSVQTILATFESNSFTEKQVKLLETKSNTTNVINDTKTDANDMDVEMKDVSSALGSNDSVAKDPVTYHHHYLTSSQLLQLQVRDPKIRIQFLTQLLIICSHLTFHHNFYAEKGKLAKKEIGEPDNTLTSIQTRAEKMMQNTPPNGKEHLTRLTWALKNNEFFWKKWKLEKCQKIEKMTLESKKFPILSVPQKPGTNYYQNSNEALEKTSSALSSHHPSDIASYIEDYADALDPEAGIEEEYHPKHNIVRTFRSLRLVKDSFHIEAMSKVRKKDGDLEGVVREVWRKEKGEELPGLNEFENSIEELVDEDNEKERADKTDDASVGSPMQETKTDKMEDLIREEEEAILGENDGGSQSQNTVNDKEATETSTMKDKEANTKENNPIGINGSVSNLKEETKDEKVTLKIDKDKSEATNIEEQQVKEEIIRDGSVDSNNKAGVEENKEYKDTEREEKRNATKVETTIEKSKADDIGVNKSDTNQESKDNASDTTEKVARKEKNEVTKNLSTSTDKKPNQSKSTEESTSVQDIGDCKEKNVKKFRIKSEKELDATSEKVGERKLEQKKDEFSKDPRKVKAETDLPEKAAGKVSSASSDASNPRTTENGGGRKRRREETQDAKGNNYNNRRPNHRNSRKYDNNDKRMRPGSPKRGEEKLSSARNNPSHSRNTNQKNGQNFENNSRNEKGRGEDYEKHDRGNQNRGNDRNINGNGRDNRGQQRENGGNRGGNNQQRNNKRRYDDDKGGNEKSNGDGENRNRGRYNGRRRRH